MADLDKSWISRDTRSLIRAVGADDQSGMTLSLSSVMQANVQVGQPYECLPQPGYPTQTIRATPPAVAGVTSSVIVRPIAAEVVIWSLRAITTSGGVVGRFCDASFEIPLTTPVIVASGPFIYTLPTWRIETGTLPAGAINVLTAEALGAMIDGRAWNRLPRGCILQLIHTLQGVNFTLDLFASDISPSQEVPG